MTDKGPDLKDISFIRPIPLHHMEPIGLLPGTDEAAALWQFLVCAMPALKKVESQTTLEGAEDQEVDLMQIAESVRKMYGLKDLYGMFHARLIGAARRECLRSALPWDTRIDAFFETGGKSYRNLTRNPDKVGL